MERRAAGEWFNCRVWAVLTSFLWSIREQTMENCRFVFYNNIGMFWCPFPLKFIWESRAQERKKQIVLSSQTSFLWSVLLSKITLYQSVCENRLVTVKKELTGGFKPIKKVALIAGAKRWRGGGGRGRKARKGKMEESAYPLSPIPLPCSIPSNPRLLSMPATQAIKKVEIFWMNSRSCCKVENGVKYYSVSKNI